MLSLRLPNPPPVLVGRTREGQRLVDAIKRAPLAIASGPDGIGKLALVEHVIFHQFAESLDRTIYVRLDSGQDAVDGVIRALARRKGDAGARRDTESAERALQLAEDVRSWVVIDGGVDANWELATLIARYARHSRWIFTTTQSPSEQVLEFAIRIHALDDTAMEQLAHLWHPELSPDECALAVASARGMPVRMRRILADLIEHGPESLIKGDVMTERVLDLLATTERPIAPAIMRELVPELVDGCLDSLAERGLAVMTNEGVALNAAARKMIVARRGDQVSALAPSIAVRLARSRDPASRAEAIRLALQTRDYTLAQTLLEEGEGELFMGPHAQQLAHSLVSVDAPNLSRWRLQAVVELGDGDVLPELVGDAQTPADRLMWAEALMRANRIEAAVAVVATLDDPGARLLAARGYSTRGELAKATAELERLRQMKDVPEPVAAAAAALAARCEALAGRAISARAGLTAARARVASLPRTTARDVWQSLAASHHDLGDLAATEYALQQIEGLLDGDPMGRFVGRRARLVRAIVQVERGQLAKAHATLAELERATGFASLHRPFLALIAAQLALSQGDVTKASVFLTSVEDVDVGTGYIGAWLATLGARIAMVDPHATTPRAAPTTHGLWPAVARIHNARLALRRGETPPDITADLALGGDDGAVEAWFAARSFLWERALVSGQAANALVIALEAAKWCGELGFVVYEAEALCGAIDAAFVANDYAARDTSIARLDVVARTLDSERFIGEVALARELAAGATPEKLEVWAAGPPSTRTRRARWLLGGDASVADAIDRLVAAAASGDRARLVTGPMTSWRDGWGVDRRRRCVWRSNGQTVPFGDKPQLWRILEALVGAPEGLSKEAIVNQAWGIPYHPLRHDKLLHNSMHKLRKLLEDEPASPKRLPTTSEGYRLGDDAPVRVVGASDD